MNKTPKKAAVSLSAFDSESSMVFDRMLLHSDLKVQKVQKYGLGEFKGISAKTIIDKLIKEAEELGLSGPDQKPNKFLQSNSKFQELKENLRKFYILQRTEGKTSENYKILLLDYEKIYENLYKRFRLP